MPFHHAILHTRTGAHPLRVSAATTFIPRFAGLMFRRALSRGHGFLLARCPSVHTAFMRCPIDVIYLDDAGTVLKCVPNLKPWRGSFSHTGKDDTGRPYQRARHTLEMASGSIEYFSIRTGDYLQHPLVEAGNKFKGTAPNGSMAVEDETSTPVQALSAMPLRQRGSAMTEFVVVGPIVTLLGLAVLQYGLLFFAKNQINHAGFMAARAGSVGNADVSKIRQAYEKALTPLYGGGTSSAQLDEALQKVRKDTSGNVRIEMLNPTKESFDDWSDPALTKTVGGGQSRVIPNANLGFRNPADIGSASGQNIQDANLIKLRITHGYEPKVPLIRLIYSAYLKWLDNGSDLFHSQLVNAGRIPVVTHVTMHMQSDAIEPASPISSPGPGNNGTPVTPGTGPGNGGVGGNGGGGGTPASGGPGNGSSTNPPPNCLTIGCTVPSIPPTSTTPADPGGGGTGGGNGCTGSQCPVCPSGGTSGNPA